MTLTMEIVITTLAGEECNEELHFLEHLEVAAACIRS